MPALNTKTREMVALSASVAANCVPCFKYHFAEALKQGCTEQEVREIIKTALTVKQRPATDIDETASQLLSGIGKAKE